MRKKKTLFVTAVMVVAVARATVEGALKKMTKDPVCNEKVVGGDEKEIVLFKLVRSSRLGISEIDDVTAELHRNFHRQRFGPAPKVLKGSVGQMNRRSGYSHLVASGRGG